MFSWQYSEQDYLCGLSCCPMQVAAHPSFKLLTLRSSPQVPENALKFTTFQWSSILKLLLQMFVTQSTCTERLDWGVAAGSLRTGMRLHEKRNRSAGSYLCLRGRDVAQADALCLRHPGLYPSWLQNPLLVSASTKPFNGRDMSCTLLSADQVWGASRTQN